MWMIFDEDGNFVGMVTEGARHNTNIFSVLKDANYIIKWIDSLKNYNL